MWLARALTPGTVCVPVHICRIDCVSIVSHPSLLLHREKKHMCVLPVAPDIRFLLQRVKIFVILPLSRQEVGNFSEATRWPGVIIHKQVSTWNVLILLRRAESAGHLYNPCLHLYNSCFFLQFSPMAYGPMLLGPSLPCLRNKILQHQV